MQVFLESEEIEIGEISDFQIDEANVEGELCQAGSHLAFYGSLVADLKAFVSRKKLALDEYNSFQAQKIRAESTKITENNIKEKVKLEPEYKRLMEEFIIAERDLTKAENLYKSQIKKTDCVIAMSYAKRQEIRNY